MTNSSDEFIVTLGVYDNKEIANRVFDEIEHGLVNERKFYVMPDSQGM